MVGSLSLYPAPPLHFKVPVRLPGAVYVHLTHERNNLSHVEEPFASQQAEKVNGGDGRERRHRHVASSDNLLHIHTTETLSCTWPSILSCVVVIETSSFSCRRLMILTMIMTKHGDIGPPESTSVLCLIHPDRPVAGFQGSCTHPVLFPDLLSSKIPKRQSS